MSPRRSRSGHGRPEKSIDVIRWAGSNHQFAALAAGASAQTYITDGNTETILRIRGELMAWVNGIQTGAVLAEIAVGALVVQAGSGTTVIQEPIDEDKAPWLFYERFVLGYEEMIADAIQVGQLSGVRIVVDNKAMRILRPGREVQLVVQNFTLNGAVPVNVNFTSRVLLGTH